VLTSCPNYRAASPVSNFAICSVFVVTYKMHRNVVSIDLLFDLYGYTIRALLWLLFNKIAKVDKSLITRAMLEMSKKWF